MLSKNSFGEYINHYRTQRDYPLNYSQFAGELGISCTFATNVENKGKHFSDETLELFASKFGLNEVELAELILQRAIDQYSQKQGKKILKNFKKMLPLYKKAMDGELEDLDLVRVKDPNPIQEIYKNIEKISNERLRSFLKADLEYAVRKFED